MEEYFIVQPVNVAQSYDNICFAVTKLWSSDQLSEMDTFPLNTWWTLVAHESDQYTVYQAIIYKCHMCLVTWIHFCSFFLYCTHHLVNILLCWYFWPCCVKIQVNQKKCPYRQGYRLYVCLYLVWYKIRQVLINNRTTNYLQLFNQIHVTTSYCSENQAT